MGRDRYEISKKKALQPLRPMGYRPAGLIVFIILYLLTAISSFSIPSVVPVLGPDLKYVSTPAQFFFDRYRSI
jgi:hypothetical protein